MTDERQTLNNHDRITIHKHAGQKDPKKIFCSDRLLLLLKILLTEYPFTVQDKILLAN